MVFFNLLHPLLTLLLMIIILIPLSVSVASEGARQKALNDEIFLLNWSDYMDPDIVEEFERRHGTKVRQVFYESDDHRDEIMASTGGTGFDLVVVSGIQLGPYVRQGWLEEIDTRTVPNLRHVDRAWLALQDGKLMAVPYFWGTLGIAYRRDMVDRDFQSWMELFRPAEDLRGRIMMLRQSRELIGAALKAMGHSSNSADPAELAGAERLLAGQREYVKDYNILKIDPGSVLVRGEVVAAMSFNGDAAKLREYCPEINFVIPREGTIFWTDHIAVLRSSPRKRLALAFIQFINEPSIAARLARFVSYATPNGAAERLLPKEFRNDPAVYPGPEILAASERPEEIPARALRQRNEILDRITSQGLQ